MLKSGKSSIDKSMSPAITHLENAVIDRRLRHGGNPILRWCASNAIIDRDPAGNKKLNKKKSREMIDGLVALSMAIGLAKRHEEQASGGMLLSMDDLPLFSKN